MTEDNSPLPTKRWYDNILYYVAAFFMPSILLFNLYNRNYAENILHFEHILILAGILAITGLLLYAAFRFASNNAEAALLLIVAFWSCFWLFQGLVRFASRFSGLVTPNRFMALAVLAFIIITLIIRRFKPPFTKVRPAFNALAVALIVLFIFNLVPGVNHYITLQKGGAKTTDGQYYIKHDFNVDPTLPKPDVYWLHMDGMMSMESVERFWGEPQDNLREGLALRGFLINEDTELNAGFTDAALVSLLSPAFYDSFFGERLNQVSTELRSEKSRFLKNEMAQVGLTYADDLVPNYELFNAFLAGKYDLYLDNTFIGPRIPMSHELSVEKYLLGRWRISMFGDLPELMAITTPINITPQQSHIDDVQQKDSNDDSVALFTFQPFSYTKMANAYHFDPDLTERDYTAIHLYPLQYEHTVELLFEYIDDVLDDNPNAIIIIQGDHGFHDRATQRFMVEEGYPPDIVLELIHSVISAVRIPTEYGGLDEPIAPLNISRVLVNRFIGENYALLP